MPHGARATRTQGPESSGPRANHPPVLLDRHGCGELRPSAETGSVWTCKAFTCAPLPLWRNVLLILALEFDLADDACPLLKRGDAVKACQALALLCIGGAWCLSAT